MRVAVEGLTPSASARSARRLAPSQASTTSVRYCGSVTSSALPGQRPDGDGDHGPAGEDDGPDELFVVGGRHGWIGHRGSAGAFAQAGSRSGVGGWHGEKYGRSGHVLLEERVHHAAARLVGAALAHEGRQRPVEQLRQSTVSVLRLSLVDASAGVVEQAGQGTEPGAQGVGDPVAEPTGQRRAGARRWTPRR